MSTTSFGASCPSGGQWFSCGFGSFFVGCCADDDPCDNGGCSSGSLYPASFDASAYGTFPDQACIDDGSLWYTCTGTDPPFMGCCLSNPCGSGCPSSDLSPALLDQANDTAFNPTPSASFVVVVQATASAATTSSASYDTDTHKSHTGAIAGGAAGGVVFLLLALGILYFWRHAKASRRHRQDSFAQRPQSLPPPATATPVITDETKQPFSPGEYGLSSSSTFPSRLSISRTLTEPQTQSTPPNPTPKSTNPTAPSEEAKTTSPPRRARLRPATPAPKQRGRRWLDMGICRMSFRRRRRSWSRWSCSRSLGVRCRSGVRVRRLSWRLCGGVRRCGGGTRAVDLIGG